MIPRISISRWGGPSDDDQRWFDGWSIAIEWLGMLIDICLAKRDRSAE